MNQPVLPFFHLSIPAQHVHYLRWANGGEYSGKREWFYPFKARFLRAHGLADGCDLQVITRKCWCGDGIFRGVEYTLPRVHWETCWQCHGTGIYRVQKIILLRWRVNGALFHTPDDSGLEPEHPRWKIQHTVQGLITHGRYLPQMARHAFIKLLWHYEPRTLWRMLRYDVRAWSQQRQSAFLWRCRDLKYRLYDYWFPVNDDEIPMEGGSMSDEKWLMLGIFAVLTFVAGGWIGRS